MKKQTLHARLALATSISAALLTACGGGATTKQPTQESMAALEVPTAKAMASGISDTAALQRALPLVQAMTLDEKIQLVHGAGLGSSPIGGGGFIKGIPRLGIPDINSAEYIPGNTPLPAPIALAASWDAALARDAGITMGKELRVKGFAEGLGFGVNLAREPRNGRTFEYLGEDPVLAGLLASERLQGMQDQKVIGTLKHFAFNGQETNRFFSNSVVDERTMRQTELLAFEIAVIKGQPGNVMCAYNLVNGAKSCENPQLLTTILKNEWGFAGKVQSDWVAAISDTVRAANAGTDEEQPGSPDDYTPGPASGYQPTFFNQKLKAAVQSGQVPLSRLDDMVLRKLVALFKVGIMDSPPVAGGTIDAAAGDAVAQRMAEQSMVLLKNAKAGTDTNTVLPLTSSYKKIVVIGGHADVAVMNGGGAGSVPPRDPSPVACNTPGATIMGLFPLCATWYKTSPLNEIKAKFPGATVTYFNGKDSAAAANAAALADVAIVFATQYSGEAFDLPSLALASATVDPANQDYDQNALISAVAAKAKRSVVVVQAGTAVTMPWISSVNSVVHAWYPGVRGGPAIANVLAGAVNPSGKLPISFPVRDADLPQTAISPDNPQVVYNEKLAMGYRWYDSKAITPLFPFGHGLSYTTFTYSGLTVAKAADGSVNVTFSLTNSGTRAGSETAQVYTSLPSSAGEPPKRLVGWSKVLLQAGEKKTITINVPAARFAIWNSGWKVPAGTAGVVVGGSSRDSRLSGSVPLVATSLAHAI